MTSAPLPTLDFLSTAVMLLDDQSRIAYLNPAAEHLFAVSHSNLVGHPLQFAFTH
ncbi:MAG: PAS domain-containing protein, partial [Gammaproteobacteria bacterium]|nr:PAS domain-containing protein [Gammaproteobacteria bacterium]